MSTVVDDSCYVGPNEEPDRYRLIKYVGGGGEAALWQGARVVAGSWEPVAIKILHGSLEQRDSEPARKRWEEQVAVLRLIQNPGVVGVHESFEGAVMHRAGQAASQSERGLYLVMNWVEGTTLAEWLATHREPADLLHGLRLLGQVAETLQWLHSGRATSGREIIHGDLTASNVIVNSHDQAVLVDFGLVKVARRTGGPAEGTRGYWAPEVVTRGEYSPASDAYSFGALTAFTLTGEPPSEDLDVMRSRLAAVPLVANTPDLLDHLMRMFHDDPVRRPRPGEWLQRLKLQSTTTTAHQAPKARTAGPPRRPPTAPPPPHRPRPASNVIPLTKRQGGMLLAGALTFVLAVAAILGGFLIADGDKDDGQPGSGSGADPQTVESQEEPRPTPTANFTTIPDVRGMNGDDAAAWLQAGGLVVRTEVRLDESKTDNTVAETIPAAGSPANGSVRLVVYRTPVVQSLVGFTPNRMYSSLEAAPIELGGTLYSNSLVGTCSSGYTDWREYTLDGEYKTFLATVGIDDGSDPVDSATFIVKRDGETYNSWTTTRKQSVDIEVPLTGVTHLVILIEEQPYDEECGLWAWGDARLEREP